jgi:hypothetical protein
MGLLLDAAGALPGLPEFFITDVKLEALPGNCLRCVFIHPIEGEVVAVVVPFACWLETRVKFAHFLREYVEPAGLGRELLAH